MNINSLTLNEKVGQRFIFGVNSDNIDDIIKLIKKYHIGGVILYKKNYNTYDEMLNVVKKIKNANKDNKIPLFISIDQEGGRVNRIPKEIHNLKNIYDVSKIDSTLVSDYANIISKILYESGINMNFAPVMDIYNGSKSNALYKRCFYGNADNISKLGSIYVEKAKENKIISVIKHFPGHGCSKYDSHFLIPYIFDRKALFNKHIIPFNELIKKDVDALMVGHLVIRGKTRLLPASISDLFIKKYLRDVNYKNLIITDEVNMLKKHLIYKHCFINKALKSSSDIILVKMKDYNEGVSIINKYKKLLDNNNLLLDKLDDSVKRIVTIKGKYDIKDDTSFDGIDIDKVNKEIDIINEKIIRVKNNG